MKALVLLAFAATLHAQTHSCPLGAKCSDTLVPCEYHPPKLMALGEMVCMGDNWYLVERPRRKAKVHRTKKTEKK